jgi:Fur family ferric uptake transcriptional regulator
MIDSKKYYIFATHLQIVMNPDTILQEYGLSKTRNRINILNLLKKVNAPLSGKEICAGLSEKCDKSTVHRTLNSLYEKKILQRVIIDHEVKYALKSTGNEGSGHENDHIHFKCSRCGKLFCLTEIEVKDYRLPDGFVKEENQFLVIGKCSQCR